MVDLKLPSHATGPNEPRSQARPPTCGRRGAGRTTAAPLAAWAPARCWAAAPLPGCGAAGRGAAPQRREPRGHRRRPTGRLLPQRPQRLGPSASRRSCFGRLGRAWLRPFAWRLEQRTAPAPYARSAVTCLRRAADLGRRPSHPCAAAAAASCAAAASAAVVVCFPAFAGKQAALEALHLPPSCCGCRRPAAVALAAEAEAAAVATAPQAAPALLWMYQAWQPALGQPRRLLALLQAAPARTQGRPASARRPGPLAGLHCCCWLQPYGRAWGRRQALGWGHLQVSPFWSCFYSEAADLFRGSGNVLKSAGTGVCFAEGHEAAARGDAVLDSAETAGSSGYKTRQ